MVIFKYEMKNHLKYILSWAIILAVCIFLMTPVYYGLFLSTKSASKPLFDTLGNTDFFQSIGVSMEYLTSSLGIYSFLTSFFMIASGIFGLHFGLSIHTKEFTARTSEYLFTKPHTRREIFWAKALTVFCGTLIVGVLFILASFLALMIVGAEFNIREFILISNSLFLLTLVLAALGLLIGSLFSNNHSPLLTAGLIVFGEYCTTSFSRIVGNKGIGFLSPYSFFGAADIAHSGFYEWGYMAWYIILLIGCLLAAYYIFMKKDVQFRS